MSHFGSVFLFTCFIYGGFAIAGDLPDPRLTPGAVDSSIRQEIIQKTVCVKG